MVLNRSLSIKINEDRNRVNNKDYHTHDPFRICNTDKQQQNNDKIYAGAFLKNNLKLHINLNRMFERQDHRVEEVPT